MSTLKVAPSVYSVGVLNPALRVFDIIMRTAFGTTYNAYLVKGEEKTALIDTVHAPFFDEFLENISSLTDLSALDYIVCNHTEPDHSGSLRRLLDLAPNAHVVASTAGHKYLAAITNGSYRQITARDGDRIDLGGLSLRFVSAPMLHWPDSMFTVCEERSLVFTCDFLGAHYCEPRMLATEITYPEKYLEEFENYYRAIFSPFAAHVRAGLSKLAAQPCELVCPSHGPILSQGALSDAISKYALWSAAPAPRETKFVLIAYVSAYGCTAALAEAMAGELARRGLSCEAIDLLHAAPEEMGHRIARADAFLLGTPTINRDALPPIWQVCAHIDAISNKQKPCGVFGSYGWSGEAVGMIAARLQGLGLAVVGEGLRVNFLPSEDELAAARAYAGQLADKLA